MVSFHYFELFRGRTGRVFLGTLPGGSHHKVMDF